MKWIYEILTSSLKLIYNAQMITNKTFKCIDLPYSIIQIKGSNHWFCHS